MEKKARNALENITDLDEIEAYNKETERLACEAFNNGPVAKLYEREFEYILGLIVSRTRALKAGEKTFSIRGYDADTLNRLLSADTIVYYPVAGYDDQQGCFEEALLGGESRTKESRQQCLLVQALLDYATAGAVYAKHIKSTSVRLWARLIDGLQQIQGRTENSCDVEEVEGLIGLERIAVDRLRRDMIVESLPPFKKGCVKGRH